MRNQLEWLFGPIEIIWGGGGGVKKMGGGCEKNGGNPKLLN